MMETPLAIIEKTKVYLKEAIEEKELEYLDCDLTFLLRLYSADLCGILLDHFPGATIMINKNRCGCATMIQGKVYNASGIVDKDNYIVANAQDILYIKRSLPQLPTEVMNSLVDKLYFRVRDSKGAYVLRKERESMI